ncbi:nucleoporin Ndc1 [Drosophila willistoni]|uniref:nucleoporin Ndc1 n=1 Tax=Drosophila willistoni TaxID=7260 RepID=UPI000C26D97C|nr:nucleoporin Ndc1 [Drosophila willistoni]
MWLTLNKGLLPDYLVEVPFLIRRLLVYRFLCATLYCICMEFGVLAVFLLCVILPVKGSPISWLCYVIKWTFFSIYTWILILPLFIGIGLYGLLLCRMHNIRPECHHVLFDRFKHNFLHKFYLMCITVALSCYTTWMYKGYIMKQLTRSEQLVMKITYADGYLMAFGNLCGLSYFFTQYAPSSFKGFKLPIASSAVLVRILRQISRSSLKEAVKTTLISATVFSQFVCDPGHDLLYHSWCLGMAISIQLHLARCIYSLVWQEKLPLSLQNFYPHSANIPMHKLLLKRLKVWFCYGVMLPVHYEDVKDIENSRKLPLFMALDCGVLHGFQMQAAMEFSATINKPIMFKQIFNVDKITGCRSWRDLRNIVMENFSTSIQKLTTVEHKRVTTKLNSNVHT